MSEGIKSAITGREGINVSGDGLYSAITGKKSAVFSAGKVVSAITGRELKSYEGACSSGSVEGSGKYRVRFFDYDGTILKTVYTDGGEVTAPIVPEHERLLFQEWNNDFDDITADLDVGAIYTTKSGKCEFDVWVNNQVGNYPTSNPRGDRVIFFNPELVSGTLTIEWGDGSTETLTTAGKSYLTHTYPVSGKYTMLVGVSEGGAWKPAANLFNRDGSGSTGAEDYSVVAMRLTGFGTEITAQGSFGTICCCNTVTIAPDVKIQKDTMEVFARCLSLKHLSIPRGMEQSNYGMLSNCWALRSCVFPQGLKTLERQTLGGCRNVQEVVIPQSVTKIWFWAFQDTCLNTIQYPPLVTEIDTGTFSGGHFRMTELVIPEQIVKINDLLPETPTLQKIICHPTVPPELTKTPTLDRGNLKEIIVPAGCGEAYKAATNWSTFADIIKEEEI